MLTPIQQLIENLEERMRAYDTIKLTSLGEHGKLVTGMVLENVKALLPAERKLLEDTWDTAQKETYDNVSYDREEQAVELDFSSVEKMKKVYLSQFNQPK